METPRTVSARGERNPDGVGILNLKTGILEKEHPTPEEKVYQNGDYFIHWRYGNAGTKGVKNVQPFEFRSGKIWAGTLGLIKELSHDHEKSDANLFASLLEQSDNPEQAFLNFSTKYTGLIFLITKKKIILSISSRDVYQGKNWIASFKAADGPGVKQISNKMDTQRIKKFQINLDGDVSSAGLNVVLL